MASFINNVIIETEGEERHDKLIKEVVKRLAKNDLYVKLKKMQVEGEESRIFRSSDRTRRNQDGGRNSKGCFGLAGSKRS